MTIRKLREAVEAGAEPDWDDVIRAGLAEHSSLIIGVLRRNSLDAALALMQAVLPGWRVHRLGQRYGDVWEAHIIGLGADGFHTTDVDPSQMVWSDTPARALLLHSQSTGGSG